MPQWPQPGAIVNGSAQTDFVTYAPTQYLDQSGQAAPNTGPGTPIAKMMRGDRITILSLYLLKGTLALDLEGSGPYLRFLPVWYANASPGEPQGNGPGMHGCQGNFPAYVDHTLSTFIAPCGGTLAITGGANNPSDSNGPCVIAVTFAWSRARKMKGKPCRWVPQRSAREPYSQLRKVYNNTQADLLYWRPPGANTVRTPTTGAILTIGIGAFQQAIGASPGPAMLPVDLGACNYVFSDMPNTLLIFEGAI